MDRMIITDQMIEDGMSKNGGWSNKQIMLLGFGRTKGWKRRAIGKQILTAKYNEFVALKNVHLKKKRDRDDSTLVKAITFIIDNFTSDDMNFHCPWRNECESSCDECSVKRDFVDITGITD